MDEQNIVKLVGDIQAGSGQAENRVIDLFSRSVRMTLLSQADYEDVDDLEQEVFRLAIEKIREGQLREPGKLAGFVIKMTKNLTIDYYRREKRLKQKAEHYAMRRIAPTPRTPLEEMICREQGAVVRRVIDELSEARDRELLKRYFILEQDREVVCRDLGLSREQFSRVLYRAKDRFKKVFLQSFGRNNRNT